MKSTYRLHLQQCNKKTHGYPRVQQTSEFTPLVMEHTSLWCHLHLGEFGTFSAAGANHYNSAFLYFVPPGAHHCWVVHCSSMEGEICWTLLLMTSSVNQEHLGLEQMLAVRPSTIFEKRKIIRFALSLYPPLLFCSSTNNYPYKVRTTVFSISSAFPLVYAGNR